MGLENTHLLNPDSYVNERSISKNIELSKTITNRYLQFYEIANSIYNFTQQSLNTQINSSMCDLQSIVNSLDTAISQMTQFIEYFT